MAQVGRRWLFYEGGGGAGGRKFAESGLQVGGVSEVGLAERRELSKVRTWAPKEVAEVCERWRIWPKPTGKAVFEGFKSGGARILFFLRFMRAIWGGGLNTKCVSEGGLAQDCGAELSGGVKRDECAVLSSSDPRHFVTSLRSKKVRRHLGSILAKARHFCGPACPPVMSYDGFSFSISDVRLGLKSHLRAKTYTIFAMRYLVKAARAAEDDLQAAVKAFADAQAHLELKRAESKIDAHGSSKRKSSTTQAPSNTSTSASDVIVAEETMPDTFLIILPDTNDS
ncbi:hypothetical protein B0H13DRAFT_1868281 [Mycena leptocephala]|nr:hypothetical protein B0H13DRAFT_1868281 [Mycena leptocephala]